MLKWSSMHQRIVLTHWGRVTHICISKLTIIGTVHIWTAPSHYLNQCWNIIDWYTPDSTIHLCHNGCAPPGHPLANKLIALLSDLQADDVIITSLNYVDRPHRDDDEIAFSVLLTASGLLPRADFLTHPHWTKWSPFCRRYFQVHFREWNV